MKPQYYHTKQKLENTQTSIDMENYEIETNKIKLINGDEPSFTGEKLNHGNTINILYT